MVKVELKETSQPLIYENVTNTYQKGDLYCIHRKDKPVVKIPLANIFKIEEEYDFQNNPA